MIFVICLFFQNQPFREKKTFGEPSECQEFDQSGRIDGSDLGLNCIKVFQQTIKLVSIRQRVETRIMEIQEHIISILNRTEH